MRDLIQRYKKFFLFVVFILAVGASYLGYSKIQEWSAPAPVYTIGIDTTWHPIHLHGAQHNMSAFASDLIFNIAKDQDIKIGLIRSGHKCVYDQLDDGKVDGVLAPVPKNQNPDYDYSEPVYRYGAVIIVKKGSDIKSLSDLEKKRVAVKRGSPILYRLTLDPNVNVLLYDNPTIALENLSKGEFDAVVMDQLLTFLYYGGTHKDGLQTATIPLTTEALRLVVLKKANKQELIEKFNSGLKHLKEDGIYRQLLEDWGLYDPEAISP